MAKNTILYIGTNVDILNIVVRLINANENLFAIGATNDTDAQVFFIEHAVEVVLLGSGITDDRETILRNFFIQNNPRAVVVQHYGGGSGLLMSEINLALAAYNK